MAQMVKRLPTMRETRVQSLGPVDLLEKEMAPYSSILAWKIPWMEESDRSIGRKESNMTEQLTTTTCSVKHAVILKNPRFAIHLQSNLLFLI